MPKETKRAKKMCQTNCLKIDQFNIFFFKEPDGEFRACTYDKPFDGISAFGDTKLEALKEFCTAMVGAIEVVEEDANL